MKWKSMMHGYLRPLSRAAVLAALAGAIVAAFTLPASSPAAGTPVSVFPVAGSRLANPKTQITFRGIPISQLGPIAVAGSKSGNHSGRLLGDSDGHGGSFVPDKPFTPGEVVTVATHQNLVGGSNGVYRFTVSSPAGGIPFLPFAPAGRTKYDVWHFHSYPQINPVAVRVTKQSSHTAHGYIFITPWYGPLQNGVEILDSQGGILWFKAVPKYHMASDFAVQSYQGKPVLTWWQGYFGSGFGSGQDVINDTSYHQIAAVNAGNGLTADLHDFQITPQGTALIFAEYPVHWNTTSVHGTSNSVVFDTVVQEIDIPTGLVMFQWDSLDHVPVTQSYTKFPKNRPYDYFHGNSIQLDRDGNLIVSGRSTSAIYKIDHSSGKIIWTLGGKASSFKFASNAAPAFQHDAIIRGSGDGEMTVFDNGAGLYNAHRQSRALWMRLDVAHHKVSEIGELDHSPSVLSQFAGSVQELQNGDSFVGWGQQPYMSEFNNRSQMIFDAQFRDTNSTYRAYRFRWFGMPKTQPRVAAANSGKRTVVWVSWNGATGVSSWRVYAGSSSSSLKPVSQARRNGFETWIYVGRTNYVQVQALDNRGHLLSTSPVTKVG
jgi:hypothetical protein